MPSPALRAKFVTHLASHNAAAVTVYTDGIKSATGVRFAAVFPGKVISGKLPFASSISCCHLHAQAASARVLWCVQTRWVLWSLSATPSHFTLSCEKYTNCCKCSLTEGKLFSSARSLDRITKGQIVRQLLQSAPVILSPLFLYPSEITLLIFQRHRGYDERVLAPTVSIGLAS